MKVSQKKDYHMKFLCQPRAYVRWDNRDTFTPILIVALITVVKLWNQARCPTTNKIIKFGICANGILFSHKDE
jgi:hypothetical protein